MATLDRLNPPIPAPLAPPAWTPRRAIAVALTLVAAIALVQVLQSTSVATSGQTMRLLEQERARLQASVHALEADVASLSALNRIERAARARLGMVEADAPGYLSVDEPGSSALLLPRPYDTSQATAEQQGSSEPWWRTLLQELPLP